MTIARSDAAFLRDRKALTTWVQSPKAYDRLVTKPTEKLRAYLDGANADDITAAYQLYWLYMWAMRRGVHDLLAGQPGALDIVARAALYGCWWFRCHLAVVRKTAKPGGNPVYALRELALLQSHALTLGMSAEADVVGDRIRLAIESGLVHGESVSHVGAYLLHLDAKRRGRELPKVTEELVGLAGYRDLLASYDSADLDVVTGAFRTACEFHVRQSRELEGVETPDFFEEVYRLYPVEILGTLRVREGLGLPLPVVPHLLLNGPTGVLQPAIQPAADPLLRGVVERIQASYADV